MMPISEQLRLLVRLRDSKERGAASMSLLQHIAVAKECEQLGWIKAHSIGPSFFCITDAGLKKLNSSKPAIQKMEAEKVKPKPEAAPQPAVYGKVVDQTKAKSTSTEALLVGRAPKGPSDNRDRAPSPPPHPKEKQSFTATERNPHGKAATLVNKMREPQGVVRDEALAIMGWKAISMQEFAKHNGFELIIDKSIRPFRYRCK